MTDKEDALAKALGNIDKRYGEGAVMRGSDKPQNIEAISTGSIALDLALGVGGIPRGRSTEMFGFESSGKTTVCQHFIANAQKIGEAAFIDTEHALDPKYAEICGVDMGRLIMSQPDTGEQALEIAEELIRSGYISALVIDSIALLVPRSEVEGDMGSAPMGGQARLMSQGLRKLTPVIQNNNVAVLWTNQIRNKIGVMYGSPEYQPGGFAMKFGASVRIKLNKVNAETDTEHAHVKARVVKNKVAPPFKEAEFDIVYLQGIDKVTDLANVSLARGIVNQSGAWISYGDQKWQGKEKLAEALRSDPVLFDELMEKVRA